MADVSSLLLASLHPDTRRQAEQNLLSLSTQSGFLSLLLQLILNGTQDRSVRLAASVYLKNTIKRRWEDEDLPLAEAEKTQVKGQLVPAMIALSSPADKTLRAQVAEAVSIVAKYDFPEQWPDLIDQLVSSLSPDAANYPTNVSVLETAHSIFAPWRSEIRSDSLYTTINFVLSRFSGTFLQIFELTATNLLNGTGTEAMAQAQVVLLSIFYDLTCQDLPPTFEDSHSAFFGADQGVLTKFLAWDPENMRGDPDDTTPSFSTQIKTSIFELAELYTHRYPEVLSSSNTVPAFVTALWGLLGGGQRSGIAYDGLVSQGLRFLSTVIRSGNYKATFAERETINALIKGVVVPNVTLREHEVEQFEDDPLEYVRVDLTFAASSSSIGGLTAEGTTRRQAAADVLRALVASGFEAETTEVVLTLIGNGLEEYNRKKGDEESWKRKDESVYLLTAVATVGATAQQGVTSTNALVDVVQFFSQHVYEDLQADENSVHPILQVDAIRFLYSFRNQLTKEQLLSVLPLLVRHLRSPNYVCYTYAATTIERILFIKRGASLLFNQEDIRELAPEIINTLLSKIEAGGTPEKIAENDYLIKCVMRVILTARATIASEHERLLHRLVAILAAICKNPSNPNFDQYIFESISALIRFTVGSSRQTLATFEQALFGPFTIILQQDIDQFIPYIFQILSQMLELHDGDVPPDYRSILPFLLQPASWAQKGSIPALVRLLRAFLARDAVQMAQTGQFTAILAVVQQKLIPSRVNDAWGFELLQSVVRYIPSATLKPLMKSVVTMLLTRLQTARTDAYVYALVYFFAFIMAIPVDGVGPDFLISSVEEVQPQLWSQLLANVVLPQIPKMLPKDRKLVIVGVSRMLTQSSLMLSEPSVRQWPAAFTELVKLFSASTHLKSAQQTVAEDPDEALRALDFEEQGAGYQAAYSKLAASETTLEDPVAYIGADVRAYVGQQLSSASKSDPRVKSLIGMADPTAAAPFLQGLAESGYAI